MKTIKRSPLIAMLFLISINLTADIIDLNTASQVGKNYYWENAGVEKHLDYNKINLTLVSIETNRETPLFYIFNINEKDGFVIISASDAVLPVIGYNDQGIYTGENVPPGLQGLLNAHANTIAEVIKQNLKPTPEVISQWQKYLVFNPEPDRSKALGPMLSTTWDQGCSYNDSCPPYVPYYDACDHAWAGCGATAMAQLLKHFNYPTSGYGSHSYQDEFPNGSGNYVTVQADFAATTYNYSAMTNYLYWPNTDANVAQLTYHCAVAANMDFDTTESISLMNNILGGMKTYFGYPNGAKWVFMNDTVSWKNLIKSEMNQAAGRPLLYWGSDINDNAHFWVCDGYNNSNMFHMNWGVFDYAPNPVNYNGYFYISSLAPDSTSPDFSYYQAAVFNLAPYCSASSLSGDSSVIKTFQLNTINNEQSGAVPWSSYNDYKNQFNTSLARGGSYGVRLKLRYTLGTQSTLAYCFVDWNQDGDFFDPSESIPINHSYDYAQFMPAPIKYYGIYEGKIHVPANALLGNTPIRVRVVPASLGYNPSCGQTAAGEVEDYLITIVAGNQPPQAELPFVFSLDIGSDTELSDPQVDGDELFDPGDCYYYDGTILPVGGMDGMINDQNILQTDPFSTPGTTGMVVPIGSGGYNGVVNFDMDGVDLLNTLLSAQGVFPMPQFGDTLIFFPDNIYLSFDDDTAPNWSDTQGSVPINSSSPTKGNIYGQTSNKDEIIEADFNASAATSLPVSIINSGNVADEKSIHPQLAPNPDNGNTDDDDVDALDIYNSSFQYNKVVYFSVDHEATYLNPLNNTPLLPSSIYEYFGTGTGVFQFMEVINSTHLNLAADTDIDAFEFVWLWNDAFQMNMLALLFSVDDDDPLTLVNESGGLNPKLLYYSFMDGFYHAFSSDVFEEDIDAITCSGKSFLAQLVPQNWQFTPTGSSHLISIPLAISPQLNGNPVAAGDLIGVFFNDGGKGQTCGGYLIWDNTGNNALMAFGDDPDTPDIKEGFDEGEEFTWKVYSYNSNSGFDAKIEYDSLWPDNDGKFYDNGLSALTSFTGYTLQPVTKFGGWSGISSFIQPLDPDLDMLLSPISNEFIILRNFEEVYWPEGGLSSLNSWDAQQGYVMKLSQDATIDFNGVPLEDRTFLLAQGWNLLPVLNANNILTSSVLDIPEVVVAKEVAGSQVYWPEQGVATLITLNTGNAYYVYANAAAVIDFSSKAATISKQAKVETTSLLPSSWQGVTKAPNSHLVAVSIENLENYKYGDVIGAFNSQRRCCGFTTIDSEKNVLTIYADDPLTPEIDGMLENEEISYKIHSFDTGEDIPVSPAFDPDFPHSGAKFISNGLSGMIIKTSGIEHKGSFINLQIQPNPARENVVISSLAFVDKRIEIRLMDIVGQIVLKESFCCKASYNINVAQLSEGTYILSVSSSEETITKKLVIHR